MQDNLRLDEENYLRDSAGRRVCKVLSGFVLEFPDRDRRRRQAVGPSRVDLMELVRVLAANEARLTI
jgi:hypothetical protein